MKKLVVGLAVAAGAISILSVQLWRNLREVNAQAEQLRSRVTELQSAQLTAALNPDAPTAASAVGAVLPPGQQAAAAPVSPAAPTATGSAEKPDVSSLLDSMTDILATPEGREMMRGQARMTLPRMYPGLARELGLNGAQEEKFFDLLATQRADDAASSMDRRSAGQMDPAARQEMQRKAQEKQQANQAEQLALLGAKYPQWQDYQKNLNFHRQVDLLQASLRSGNNTLSDAQTHSLVSGLAAERTRIQEEVSAAPRPQRVSRQEMAENELKRSEEENRRLVIAASAHLNSQQLDGYRNLLEQEATLQRAALRMMTQQAAGQK